MPLVPCLLALPELSLPELSSVADRHAEHPQVICQTRQWDCAAGSHEGTSTPGANTAERGRHIYLVLDHPLCKSGVVGLIGVRDIGDVGFCRRSTAVWRWGLLPSASAKPQTHGLCELGGETRCLLSILLWWCFMQVSVPAGGTTPSCHPILSPA